VPLLDLGAVSSVTVIYDRFANSMAGKGTNAPDF